MLRSSFARHRVALLLLLAVTAVMPAAGHVWPMFQRDFSHSGFGDFDAPFDSMLAWSYATGDTILYASPVVAADGTIYIGNNDKELVALSPTGERLWSYHAGGSLRHSTPAIDGAGTIYVGGSNGRLYAVHPDSTLKWTFTAGGAIKSAPTIDDGGRIYFGADDGLIYAVNPDSTLAWSYATGDTVRCSPAIGPDGTVFVGSTDNYLYALWPNGSLRWRAATGGPIRYAAPTVTAAGVVYFGSYDGWLYAVTSDQQFLWGYDTEHVIRSTPCLGPDGRIYIGAGSDLLCLNVDGGYEWHFSADGTIASAPVYFGDDDRIGFGADDGVFYCVESDGSLDWRYTVRRPIRSSAAPSGDGNIYVADLLGTVYAFGSLGDLAVDDLVRRWGPPAFRAVPNVIESGVRFEPQGAIEDRSPLLVLDTVGRIVARIAGGDDGVRHWDGRDRSGRPLPAGLYFHRTRAHPTPGRLVIVR